MPERNARWPATAALKKVMERDAHLHRGAGMTDRWRETVRAVYDEMHFGNQGNIFDSGKASWLAKRVIAMIEQRHPGFFSEPAETTCRNGTGLEHRYVEGICVWCDAEKVVADAGKVKLCGMSERNECGDT